MYNLLISSNADRWRGNFDSMPINRCLNPAEFTAIDLIDNYCQFTHEQNEILTCIHAVFGYESQHKQDAQLGRILSIKKTGGDYRLDFELHDSYPPIPNAVLERFRYRLGIQDFEMHRNHWALKEEDLGRVLSEAGLPPVPVAHQPLINIREHNFQVALSFPGEVRSYIETVATQLVRSLGHNTVFYDNFYKSQLAVLNLDTALQNLYRNRAILIVVFLSADYAQKKWCGIEFRAIREIINAKKDEHVMFVRFDNSEVEGVFSHDGYLDANELAATNVASLIQERISLLQRAK